MPPVVVLVAPEIPENVGFVARSMACFGTEDLRIVSASGIAGCREALRTGAGAQSVLRRTRYFDTLSDAVPDCQAAVGFTRRPRLASQKVYEVRELLERLAGGLPGNGAPAPPPEGTALVFGRESQGLSRDEALAMTHLARIPTPDARLSLNLSHAVTLALWEWTRPGPLDPEGGGGTRPPARRDASMAERERVFAEIIAYLKGKGFLKAGNHQRNLGYLRILWQRLEPGERELAFLAGLVRRSLDP